ncbi:MAG: RHS repeat-associated core domain-containing protein, partial [Phycisphaerae bacterium]
GHLLDGKGTDNLTTHYSYSTGGTDIQTEHALTGIEYPDGTHRTFTYDGQGRLYETYRDGEAEKLTYSYDSAGTVCQTDAYGAASRYFLGAEGGVLKVQNAVDNAVQYQFDDHFNLVQISDSAGRAHSFRYDYEGNLTHWTDPLGYRTRFSYGDFGRLAYFTDANSHKTTYTYDSQGNLTAITYPDAVVESFEYDAAGNLTDWTNGRQATIGYTPDAQGRITRKDYDDGSHVDYTYDARGNLETATDATGTTSFTHSANDWLTRIDYPDGRFLEFTYDTAGRRDSSTDELGHTVNYHYDAVGRLERLTDGSDAEIVLYARNAAGRLERAELGNGVYTTYEYDAAGQLLHLVNYAPDDTVLSRFDYTYDAAGRRDGMTTLDGTWTYAHDPAGQLIAATFELDAGSSIPAQEMAWTYDRVGNRRSATTNGATIEYTTNNRNQYVTVGAASYEYDDDGNLIGVTDGSDTWSFEYDDEGRLTRAVTPDGTWEYEYDPLGRRVATVEGAQRTEYVIDPIGLGNVVGQYDGTGALEAHYVHGLGLTSRVDAAGQPAYYTFDALGSTSELTDDAGAVLNAYAYDPFGKLLLQTGTLPDPFQFVGQFGVMTEDTGLDLMRARSYDPALGRFVSEDPIGLAGGDVLLYRYARNAPVDFIDPLGLFDVYDFATWELAAAGTAAGVACALVAPSCPVTGTGAALAGLGVLAVAELRPPPLPRPRTPRPDEIEMEDAEFTWTTDLDAIAESIGAVDPNAKTGPTGFGDSGYVAAGRLLAYRVDFENEETATAPAQYVSVCDQLDADLDWTTFDLTEVGFGEHFIATPAGTQHFETVVPVTCEGQDIEVHIEAGIDLETGLLVVQFMSLDAETHLPPDVTIGFLPPEDGSGCGMGHFSYTIENAPDVPSGTEVRNVAVIQFDFGEIIATNQVDPHDPGQGTDPAKECLNTIDAGPPTSQVDPLEAEVSDLSFTVSWSGQDDDGGSGLRGYDVYVSDDGGPYELWLDDVAETSAVFTGEHLHTYGFYSIADDNVGHREKPPGAADTQTLVNDTTPPVIESWQSAAEHGEGVGEALLEIPDDGGFSEPRTAGVTRLVIGFSEAIDPASFTPASVRLAGNDQAGDPVDLSGIAVSTSTASGDTVAVIDFDPALPDVARYLVQVDGVTDAVGNLLAGDNNRILTAQIGDSMEDLRVNAIDLSYIWPRRTVQIDGVSEDQTRSDVDCDGRVNAIDLSATWPRRGGDMRN